MKGKLESKKDKQSRRHSYSRCNTRTGITFEAQLLNSKPGYSYGATRGMGAFKAHFTALIFLPLLTICNKGFLMLDNINEIEPVRW